MKYFDKSSLLFPIVFSLVFIILIMFGTFFNGTYYFCDSGFGICQDGKPVGIFLYILRILLMSIFVSSMVFGSYFYVLHLESKRQKNLEKKKLKELESEKTERQ